MSEDFKPIETQEQLNAIIQKRVEQAKRSGAEEEAKKYADYDDLKEKAGKVTDLETELNKLKEDAAGLDDLKAKVHKYEIDSVKTKVALEEGLPYEFAARLNGEDEETIKADAQAMAKLIKPIQGAPMGGAEPIATPSGDKDAALRQMARDLAGGEE